MDEDLVAWGRVARLETRGRVTGRPARAVVGFVEQPDGSLLVAAARGDADWALNLQADPRCRVTVGEDTRDMEAHLLHGPEHAAAVRELILRYGNPAERLGAGPSFRVRPLADGGGAPAGSPPPRPGQG